MDIYCPRCGEPWDTECLHEEAQLVYGVPYYAAQVDPDYIAGTYVQPLSPKNPAYDDAAYGAVYRDVRAAFQGEGCAALAQFRGTKEPCEARDNDRAKVAGVMYDLLGDDLDGAAAMMEDAAAFGFDI